MKQMKQMKQMKLMVVLSAVVLCCSGRAGDLDALLSDGTLFTHSRQAFAKKYARTHGFRSQSRDGAEWRAAAGSKLLEMPVIETLVSFKEDKMLSVSFSIYNRGDVQMLSKDAFEALVKKVATALTKKVGKKPRIRRKTGASKKDSHIWIFNSMVFQLDSKGGKIRVGRDVEYRSEYVRLRLLPYDKKAGLSKIDSGDKRKRPKDYVVTKDNGDVYVSDVPMINQGSKGYCACATAARVLQHYGRKLDMHELAQIAKTDPRKGTSAEELMKGLRSAKSKLNIGVKTLQSLVGGTGGAFKQMVRDYNILAKKKKSPKVQLVQNNVIDVARIYSSMKPEILVESRVKHKSSVTRFQREVMRYTKDGVPLFWSLMLGIVKEPDIPQAVGGHMRLIIGYNKKTEEIVYTDSWGNGHEFKKMKLSDAYAITTGLYAITPK